MRIAALLLLAACGRLGFDTTRAGDGGVGDATDAPSGVAGPRWLHGFGPVGLDALVVGGAGGEVVAAGNFTGTQAIDGATLVGQSPFHSAGIAWWAADGTLVTTTVADSDGYCEARGVTMAGGAAIVSGFTIGGAAVPGYGPCSIATGRQEPVVLRIDRSGAQTLAAHWSMVGISNAQAWSAVTYPDGTVGVNGIYSDQLTIGAALPAAGADPNAFVARFVPGADTPRWARAVTGGVEITVGAIALDGDEMCVVGGYSGAVTLLGQALPYAGGSFDEWVARLDGAGNPKWIRGFGTALGESGFGEGTVIAVPGGGCLAVIDAPADLSLDGFTFPAADGPNVSLTFDAGGTVVDGLRLPSRPIAAVAGDKILGAFTLTAPLDYHGATVTPEGSDVVVFSIDSAGAAKVEGVVGGAGDQVLSSFAAIGDGAVAISVTSNGELVFGDEHRDSGGQDVWAVAALGL